MPAPLDSAECIEYLREHGLAAKLDEVLADLLRDKPEDPFPYLAMKLDDSLRTQIEELEGKIRALKAPKRTLTLVHFNDVYHVEPFVEEEPRGGASRFSAVLRQIQRDNNAMVMFSGDFIGPSVTSAITKGRHMVDVLNYLNVHYGVYGNHEFDYGLEKLTDLINGYRVKTTDEVFPGSETTWIMSNVLDKKTNKPLGDAVQYERVRWNGIELGILGLVEDWISSCPCLEPEHIQYTDLFETGQRLALQLKREGAEYVIALSHSRIEVDRELAAKAPDIDLILGGHDHFYKNDFAESRLIKSGQEFQFLSEVTVTFREGLKPSVAVKTHQITSDIPPDTQLNARIDAYGEYMAKRMKKVYLSTAVPLDSTEEELRFKESALGNWLAEVIALENESDCAIICGAAIGGKRVTPPGPVTLGDFLAWFPSECGIMVIEIPGSYLQRILTYCAKKLPGENGNFSHCYNIKQTIDTRKPWQEGRVHSIFVKGEPLDPKKRYSVAVTDFLGTAKGGFGFLAAPGTECKVVVEDEYAMQMVDHLKNHCRGTNVTINPTVGNTTLIL
eukprot:TRINITY_DN3778_c0_g1_i1.p1 TRINITY_DN3778_c0_g1~~TRINITY_DN3778_c0_g1_i1.p1  ORF type:complete len:559 (-),score=125.63 TRINITY_DN3778_c0_g1_i1:243-1919(-)